MKALAALLAVSDLEQRLQAARERVDAGQVDDDADHLRRMVGNRPGVEDAVGPVAAAAVEFALAGSVGVHREEVSAPDVRDVGVLPTQVEDAAVVGHRRAVVVVLIEAELTHV